MRRFALASLFLAASATAAHADLRSFTHTYEYATMPAGQTAIELWHTQSRATWDADSPQGFEERLELEHGLTDHWDMAFYTVFAQTSAGMFSEPLHLSEIKLESRYRFAERGELPIDTLLYGEIAKEFGESVYELELKLVGARDFGDVTAVVNAIGEVKFGKDVDETELELGYAAGITYPVHPKFRIGAESWGTFEEDEAYISAGPAVSYAGASNFWVTLTTGFGLTDEADAFDARAIFGIEL